LLEKASDRYWWARESEGPIVIEKKKKKRKGKKKKADEPGDPVLMPGMSSRGNGAPSPEKKEREEKRPAPQYRKTNPQGFRAGVDMAERILKELSGRRVKKEEKKDPIRARSNRLQALQRPRAPEKKRKCLI